MNKVITAEELQVFLRKHKMWLANEPSGERADLRGADLRGANLYGANLCGANLCGANLREANLREANLYGANLREADLCGANLYGANLYGANLCGANLCGADLRGANLYGAKLCGANLREADLRGANLREADLRGANLDGATGIPGIACPEEGEFIGWKKAYDVKSRTPYIVKLRITKDAKRSSATSRKCRCSKAIVEGIYTLDMKKAFVETVRSDYDCNFLYTVGKTVEVSNFDDNRWNECAPGIHFFITKQEAIDY